MYREYKLNKNCSTLSDLENKRCRLRWFLLGNCKEIYLKNSGVWLILEHSLF